MEIKFVHKISKGSRFNQIYIPKDKDGEFEVGDLVEIKLLEKSNKIYYSKNLKKVSEFKERLIKEIFGFLSGHKEIERIFLFGSFLTMREDYNDIDILILSDKEKIEEEIYENLANKFNLKFHLIKLSEEELEKQMRICPLIRGMICCSVSNKKIEDLPEREIDINYIKFLLMLPEDILDIEVNSKMLYDSLRRSLVIERFLKNNGINIEEVNKFIISLIGNYLYNRIRKNEIIKRHETALIKEIIRDKLKIINHLLKNGKK